MFPFLKQWQNIYGIFYFKIKMSSHDKDFYEQTAKGD